MKVSIIIPAHNEEKRIGKTLDEYGKFFSEKKNFDFEIIVVLNACKDKTRDVVKKYEKKYPLIKHLEFERGGKGFAIIKGFEEALSTESKLIGFVDADMATSPEDFYDLIENLGNADGIIASRWKKGAKQNYNLIRKITSRGFNFIARSFFLLPYADTQCGAKIFRRDVGEKIIKKIKITEWAFDVNLLYEAKKQKFKIKEHPTNWLNREKSKVRVMGVTLQMFFALIRLRLIHSPFNFVVSAYDKIPSSVKINRQF